MKRIALTTYYQGLHKNKQSMRFSVPLEWLEYLINEDTLQDFLETYTWDEALEIKKYAKDDGVFRYA